jgi:hypothetical protein
MAQRKSPAWRGLVLGERQALLSFELQSAKLRPLRAAAGTAKGSYQALGSDPLRLDSLFHNAPPPQHQAADAQFVLDVADLGIDRFAPAARLACWPVACRFPRPFTHPFARRIRCRGAFYHAKLRHLGYRGTCTDEVKATAWPGATPFAVPSSFRSTLASACARAISCALSLGLI